MMGDDRLSFREILHPFEDVFSVLKRQPRSSVVYLYFIRIAGNDAINAQRIRVLSELFGDEGLVLHLVQQEREVMLPWHAARKIEEDKQCFD